MRRRLRFELGALSITPGAERAFGAAGVEQAARLLHRHLTGDWGEMDAHDRRINDEAVRNGGPRMFSQYTLATGERIWIVTEPWADPRGGVTTILLPEEY